MEQLTIAARGLDCPPLVAYLDARQRAMEIEWQRLMPNLAALEHLATVLR